MSEPIWTGRTLTVEDGEHVEVILEEIKLMIANEMRRRWLFAPETKHGNKAMARTRLTDREVKENFGPAVDLPEPPEDVGKTREELVLEQSMQGEDSGHPAD